MKELDQFDFKKKMIIGHRGFRAKYPENTIVSFQAALDAGADMIELDVRLSKDKQLVVIHDDDLDRTTSGKGPVNQYTMSELKRLDAGSWFDSRFSDERLPALADTLKLVRGHGLINVEIKAGSDETDPLILKMGEMLVDVIRQENAEKTVLVSSFNKTVLKRVSRMSHPPALGVLTKYGEKQDALAICKMMNAFSWHPYYLDVDEEIILTMHRLGIKVLPYTINSEPEIVHLFKMGVDGVFTDNPAMAVGIRKTF